MFVSPIVEGHSEVISLPILIRRIAYESGTGQVPLVNPPVRVKASSFFQDVAYFNKYVALAAAKAAQHPKGLVLILLDCEDDCPAKLGPRLLQQAAAVRNVPCLVALACREYETWFLTAAESLRGVQGLPGNLQRPPNADDIRGAKEWLSKRMPQGYN